MQNEISPEEYRYLRIANCSSTTEIARAGRLGMDMVQVEVARNALGIPAMTDASHSVVYTNLITTLRACRQARVGVYLVIRDGRIIPWLARILSLRDWSDYVMTGARRRSWVTAIKARLPHYRAVLIMADSTEEPLARARKSGASYVHTTEPDESWLTASWMWSLQNAGLGIVCGPAHRPQTLSWLQSLGLEGIVVRDPEQLEPAPNTQSHSNLRHE